MRNRASYSAAEILFIWVYGFIIGFCTWRYSILVVVILTVCFPYTFRVIERWSKR